MRDFVLKKDAYGEQRDFPRHSWHEPVITFLALGIITVRQCLAAMEAALDQLPFERGAAGFVWLNELIWREFYQHLLVAFSSVKT